MAQVSYGTITITDTTDKNIFIRYSANSDGSNSTSNPVSTTKYVGIYCGTAQTEVEAMASSTGWNWSEYIGSDGLSVKSTRILYYLKTNSANVPQVDGNTSIVSTDTQNVWTSKNPTYVTNGTYWTCLEITLSDNTTKSWSAPAEDLGLTKAAEDAAEMKSLAQHANENANGALSISRATQQNFWWWTADKVISSSLTLPAGAYVSDIREDPFLANPTGGYLISRSDGLFLNYGQNVLMGLSGNALKFYRPGTTKLIGGTETIDAQLDANGLKLTKGGIEAGEPGNNDFIYLSTNVYNKSPTINIGMNTNNWRQIIGSNFGVTANGALYSTEARIGNENSYLNFTTQIDYVVTKDETVNPSKTYYTYDDNTDTYIEVVNPSGDPSDKDPEWFEQITNGTLQIVGSSIQVGGQDLSTAINNKADNNMMLALDAIVNSQAWKDEFWEYELTEDNSVIEDKQYYQYEFSLTSDTEILLDKTYYIYTPLNNNDYYTPVINPQKSELLLYYERGDNLEQYNFNNLITANPQALELYELIENNNNYITNFLTSHLSISSSGLTITDKNSQYKIFLGYDGLYILEEIEKTTIIEGEVVKSTEDIVVSKFGENVEFNNNKSQRIGNDNTYIQFTPEVEEYVLTTDNTVVLNKSYYWADSINEYTIVVIQSLDINPNNLGWYEKVNNVYQITDDESLILGKDYYVDKSSEKIKITIVDNDGSINPHANNWYEKINNIYQVTDDESLLDKDYYIQNTITNYNLVSDPSGDPQSQNWFEKKVYDGFLEVVASRLIVSNNSVDNFISATNERIKNIDTELNTNSTAITDIRDEFDEFHKSFQNYIIIDSSHGFIRVGHEIQSEDLGTSSSYVEIDGASSSPKVSINVGGQEVVYMSSDRFHAPSAVVTSLFMQRENTEGTGTIGEIGWVMRSNKHLSLKRIK